MRPNERPWRCHPLLNSFWRARSLEEPEGIICAKFLKNWPNPDLQNPMLKHQQLHRSESRWRNSPQKGGLVRGHCKPIHGSWAIDPFEQGGLGGVKTVTQKLPGNLGTFIITNVPRLGRNQRSRDFFSWERSYIPYCNRHFWVDDFPFWSVAGEYINSSKLVSSWSVCFLSVWLMPWIGS